MLLKKNYFFFNFFVIKKKKLKWIFIRREETSKQFKMSFSNTTTNPSIYIPRVFSNIGWKQVKTTFEEIFGEGTIARVDVVVKKSLEEERNPSKKFNHVYVHFKMWPDEFDELRQKLVNGDTIKIVYDEPWYWMCMLNKSPKNPDQPSDKSNRRPPYIQVDETMKDAQISPPPQAPNPTRKSKEKGRQGNSFETLVNDEDSES